MIEFFSTADLRLNFLLTPWYMYTKIYMFIDDIRISVDKNTDCGKIEEDFFPTILNGVWCSLLSFSVSGMNIS